MNKSIIQANGNLSLPRAKAQTITASPKKRDSRTNCLLQTSMERTPRKRACYPRVYRKGLRGYCAIVCLVLLTGCYVEPCETVKITYESTHTVTRSDFSLHKECEHVKCSVSGGFVDCGIIPPEEEERLRALGCMWDEQANDTEEICAEKFNALMNDPTFKDSVLRVEP